MQTGFPLQPGLTATLSDFCAEVCYDALPNRTKSNLRLFFLDYIAAVHAGYRINLDINSQISSIFLGAASSGASRVFFSDVDSSATDAAFLNAFYSHGADMDDGNKLAAGHIGSHVISSLISICESRKVTIRQFYEAMLVGYEVFCRLSSACMPELISRGFHSTGTAGAPASAAACAKLLGLDSEGIANALSFSATQSSGLLLASETRQDMKALNPANAARVGVLSALLAEKGIKAPIYPLESARGWLHAMTSSVDLSKLIGGLGQYYCIDQSYLKPYPSCRHTHCAIELALKFGKTVEVDDIAEVVLTTYRHAIDLAGQIDIPASIGEAKFSIKYAIAISLSRGSFSLSELDPKNLSVLEHRLIDITRLEVDDSFERPDEGVRGARLEIRTYGGRIIHGEVLVPKGDPENPFDADDIKGKIHSCFSDAEGNANPSGADAFLEWYLPILEDPNNPFVFPQQRGV